MQSTKSENMFILHGTFKPDSSSLFSYAALIEKGPNGTEDSSKSIESNQKRFT